MSGFTKLFNSILYSTIWQEPNATRILWITMLAMSDKNGEVMASVPGLAKTAGITIPECRSGLETLMSPDPDSRTKDHDGRRIEEVDGGWNLLNHGKYRQLLSAEERKEYNRKKQAETRERTRRAIAEQKLKPVNDAADLSMTVNDNQQCQHISEAEGREQSTNPLKESPLTPQGGDSQELFRESNIDQKDRYLPKDWRKITKADQKKIKVLKNSPSMNQIGSWFGRREGTLWTIAEAASLMMVKPSQSEIDGMGIYYQAQISADDDIRRRDLQTLLNNWSGELDRARKFVNDQAA